MTAKPDASRPLVAAIQSHFWILFGSIWLLVGLPFVLLAGYFIIVGSSQLTMLLIFSFVGGFLSIAGGTIVTIAVRRAGLRTRLLTAGVRAPGTVVEVTAMNLQVNGRTQWKLKYEYRDHQSRSHLRSMYLDAEEAGRWNAGDIGDVLFDPNRPDQAVWIGRTDVTTR